MLCRQEQGFAWACPLGHFLAPREEGCGEVDLVGAWGVGPASAVAPLTIILSPLLLKQPVEDFSV